MVGKGMTMKDRLKRGMEGRAGGGEGVVHGPHGEDGVERRRLRRGEDRRTTAARTERKREGQQLRLSHEM